MYQEIIKDIRTRCRMAMNGVASASMRVHGLNYKLNFGVSTMQLKDLAKRYDSNSELAGLLWADGTRELKILATLLYPKTQLTKEIAKRWISDVPNQEIREQLCLNLLQFSSEAKELGIECANNISPEIRATGYVLLSRILVTQKYDVQIGLIQFTEIWNDLLSDNVSLKNGAKLFLQNLGKTSNERAEHILSQVSDLKDSEDLVKKEIFDSLTFEFEFYHQKGE